MGHSVANTRACYEKNSTNTRVAIGAEADIRVNSSKDAFRLSLMPFLLCGALSIYSRGVNKWALSC
jgi:hypothetical protein